MKTVFSICISVFNNALNVKALVDSIRQSGTIASQSEILIRNDGSSTPGIHEELQRYCDTARIVYLNDRTNRGVPYSWNHLTKVAKGNIIVMLNDDLRAGPTDVLASLDVLFHNNSSLGIVYWCQRLLDPTNGVPVRFTTDSDQLLGRKDARPIIRHNFSGAFFAFRKELWDSIDQPDGSTGFWSDLQAYGEEFDFSSEALSRGYFIVQIRDVWDHYHSTTFKASPHLRVRSSLSSYLSMDEFVEHSQKSTRPSSPSFKSLVRRLLSSPSSTPRSVPKLEYSLAMLQKKWKTRSVLGVDGAAHIARMLIDGAPMALVEAFEKNPSILPPTVVVPGDVLPWELRTFRTQDLLVSDPASLC